MSPAEMGLQSGRLPTVTVLWSPVMSPAEMSLQSVAYQQLLYYGAQ